MAIKSRRQNTASELKGEGAKVCLSGGFIYSASNLKHSKYKIIVRFKPIINNTCNINSRYNREVNVVTNYQRCRDLT